MKYELEIKGDGIIKLFRGPIGCDFGRKDLPRMDMIRIAGDSDEDAIEHLTDVLKQSERHSK